VGEILAWGRYKYPHTSNARAGSGAFRINDGVGAQSAGIDGLHVLPTSLLPHTLRNMSVHHAGYGQSMLAERLATTPLITLFPVAHLNLVRQYYTVQPGQCGHTYHP
jgi:hypothetical protein